MVKIYVDDAIKQLKADFKHLDGPQTAKAICNAINRTLLKGRTVARSEVKNIYNIPQKNLQGIAKKDARLSLLIGHITASTSPIPMDAFSPKFEAGTTRISISRKGAQKVKQLKKAKKSPTAGVSIEVLRGNRQTIAYAFMIPGAKPRVFARGAYRGSGSWGFLQRNKRVSKSGSDTPIKPLVSVTVHAAVINEKSLGNISKEVEAYYPQRLLQELKYQTDKMR